MAELLSLRAYSRHRGVTLRAVQKAIQTGRISTVNGKIDPDDADARWGNVDLEQQRRGVMTPTGPRREESAEPEPPAEEEEIADEERPRPAPGQRGRTATVAPPAGAPTMARSQAVRMAYQAQLAKIDYEERIGKLVNADEVKVAAYNAARKARDRLLSVPDRIAPILAAVDDEHEVHRLLSEELRKVCSVLGGTTAAERVL